MWEDFELDSALLEVAAGAAAIGAYRSTRNLGDEDESKRKAIIDEARDQLDKHY